MQKSQLRKEVNYKINFLVILNEMKDLSPAYPYQILRYAQDDTVFVGADPCVCPAG